MADQPHTARWAKHWVALGVAGLLLVVLVVGWLGFRFLNDRDADQQRRADERRHWCAGLDTTRGLGFQLHKTDDGRQCIGWTIDRTVAFGSTEPRVWDVVGRIVEENTRVRDHAAQYVRVGVLLPMPADASKPALLPDAAYHALQGAYAAQRQANTAVSTLGDPALQIQLVLVNEGARQELWSDDAVVPALGRLKDDRQHPLVAVTGMGISIPATTQAAAALHNLGLPVIGSVLTADDMVAPDLFKVAPSNHQYAQALRAFLDTQAALPHSRLPASYTGYLVFDRNPADNYVQSLYAAIMDTFGTDLSLADRSRGFDGSLGTNTTVFELHSNDICTLKPDVIFYAGRDRDLQALVDALRFRSRCTQGEVTPLLIATGSTGLNLSAATLDQARIGILDASSTDPQGWRTPAPDTPWDYAAFHTLFTGSGQPNLGYPESDLSDGYAIMHRDAVAAAVRAARWYFSARVAAGDRAGSGQPGVSPLPTATDVRNSLYSISADPMPGASGSFYFREKPQNDLWPIGKPVPVIRVGSAATSLPTATTTYRTRCQIRSHPDQPTNYHTQDCQN